MIISIIVVNQKLKATSNLESIISGTQEFVQFKFALDKSWNDLKVFAQFIQDGNAYNSYLDDDNCTYLPSEILPGSFNLVLYGSGENVIATTNYLTFTVDENILISDAQSTDISLSLYEQLINYCKSLGVDITVDSTPVSGSTNAVSSGGVFTALDELRTDLTDDISNKADTTHTHTINECQDALLSKTYTGILRSSASYPSPYTASYFYFGQFIPTDLNKPAHITYHILAYATENSTYLLDATVRWDVSTDGIYKAYKIWNNLNSTSYYPFGYHSLYRSNNATISASDGCYFGGYYGTSKSYGQNANTVERTFEVEILEAENCTVSLTDSVVFFDDTDNMPSNLVQTSTSYALNTTNFTAVNVSCAVGLQETGDANSSYYDRMVYGYSVADAGAASGRYSIGFINTEGKFCSIAQTSSTGTTKTLNTSIEIDPNLCFYLYSATYAANATIAASNLYSRFSSVDIRYSCNQGSWMTARQPVYLILSMADSGFFTVNDTVFTHTLPTSADGYYYKYVGMSYDTYRFVFEPKETLYYHDGTKLCRY